MEEAITASECLIHISLFTGLNEQRLRKHILLRLTQVQDKSSFIILWVICKTQRIYEKIQFEINTNRNEV